jgi:methionine synthase II (cobalamin-independent)
MDWECVPACIGSLPHEDPAAAVDLVLRCLKQVPYWPQLPGLGFGENMYAQYSTKLPGIDIDAKTKRISVDLMAYEPEEFYEAALSEDLDYFAYPKGNFHGLYELLSRRLPADLKAIKGQVTGPVSLGLQIFDATGKSVVYDEAYSEIIRKNLNLMLRWQERELQQKCARALLFLDEPSLSLVGTPFAAISPEKVTSWINEVFENVNCIKGLHCCGNTDWPTVLKTNVDVLSFDAYNYGHTISLYPDEVKHFLERGGSIAWGIIPNQEDELRLASVPSLIEKLERAMASLVAKGVDSELLHRTSLLTPQCGLGSLDEVFTTEALLLLNQVSKEFRRLHSLEG